VTIQQLLGRLHAADVRLSRSKGDLVVSGKERNVDATLLDALRMHKTALLDMMDEDDGGWWHPPEIRPDAFALVDLDQETLDRIIASVPGGASNVQDIYPLAPLQEGILFHHLMNTEGDPYLLEGMLSFETRERLDAYLTALRGVIARHDILRTAIAWEGLPDPLQVLMTPATWSGPVSHAAVAINFSQHIGANDALRTGSYSKTLTFTLSTTNP